MFNQNYFVYITTNTTKSTLYIGITNDLTTRLTQHFQNSGNPKTFAGRYFCYNLIYFERFDNPTLAIDREKELKGWNRAKKMALIQEKNPELKFLNHLVFTD